MDCAVDDENLPAFYGQQTIIVSEKSIYYWNISANKVDMRGSARYVFPENTKGCACVRFINDGQRVSAAGLEEVDSAIAELLQKNPKEQYVFLNGISREEYPSTEPLLLNAKIRYYPVTKATITPWIVFLWWMVTALESYLTWQYPTRCFVARMTSMPKFLRIIKLAPRSLTQAEMYGVLEM